MLSALAAPGSKGEMGEKVGEWVGERSLAVHQYARL